MKPLVILMMEEEQPEGISARKLVVETAKHNVLTAYSADSGVRLLRRFPNVDAVLVHSSLVERRPGLIDEVKLLAPNLPLILACPYPTSLRQQAKYTIDSHNPQELLQILHEKIEPRAF